MGTYEQIRGVDEAYGKAVANQDIDAIVALYTPDAFFLPPTRRSRRDRTRSGRAPGVHRCWPNSLDLDTTVLDEQGDVVIEVGQYKLGLQPSGAEPITDLGKYLQVFKRQADGSFLIVYDCFNSDEPAS